MAEKTKSTQLKTVAGFLPYGLGGMAEEGNESFHSAGGRCLTLLCPSQIQPRVAKDHLAAWNQVDLVPAALSFAWRIPPAGRGEGAGAGQASTELLAHRQLPAGSFRQRNGTNVGGKTYSLFFPSSFSFQFLFSLPWSQSSDFSLSIFITFSQFSHSFSEKAHLLLLLSSPPPHDLSSFFPLSRIMPVPFFCITFI